MKSRLISRFAFFALLVSLPALSQTNSQTNAASSSCPLALRWFDSSNTKVGIQNVSGKTIVGLSFYAAVADATEHWKWLHWNWDDTAPLREFGWNKMIKPDARKSLYWGGYVDFEHGSGGVFVLTNVLYSDGSSWEDPADRASCRIVWYDHHKKSFAKPIELPVRR